MKKVISIILVAIMLFSFAACDKKGSGSPDETLPLDIEALKADWKKGTLVFPGDKTVNLPCTLSEFVENSGVKINKEKTFEGRMLEPDESMTFYVSIDGANMKITVKNITKEAVSYMDANVSKYSYNNSSEANRQIKFVNTLSPGVSRSDVEKALEIPENRTSEDVLYIYEGRNTKNKKIELIVAFNSDNVVNSVSYEILY